MQPSAEIVSLNHAFRLREMPDTRNPEADIEPAGDREAMQQGQVEAFLLKELEMMESEIKRLRGEGQTRLQFLVTITSAVLGSLVALSGVDGIAEAQLRGASIVATFMLYIFALATYEYTIGRDISTDRNARATSRIRRYFLECSPGIIDYLSWQTEDGPTQWVTKDRSRIRTLIMVIAAGLGGLCAGLIAFEISDVTAVGYKMGIPIGFLTIVILKCWAVRKLRRAKDTAIKEQRFGVEAQQ